MTFPPLAASDGAIDGFEHDIADGLALVLRQSPDLSMQGLA